MKKSLPIILTCFLFSMSSHASSIRTTKITQVLVGPYFGKNVLLTISDKATVLPPCQTNNYYNYVFDGTTEEGKMTLSVALAAYATQKDVWLGGTNTCSLFDGVENLAHIVAK